MRHPLRSLLRPLPHSLLTDDFRSPEAGTQPSIPPKVQLTAT
jgi:hypothetical protein